MYWIKIYTEQNISSLFKEWKTLDGKLFCMQNMYHSIMHFIRCGFVHNISFWKYLNIIHYKKNKFKDW